MDRMTEERLAEFSEEADTYPPDDEFVLLVREIQRARANEDAQAQRIAALEAALRWCRMQAGEASAALAGRARRTSVALYHLNALEREAVALLKSAPPGPWPSPNDPPPSATPAGEAKAETPSPDVNKPGPHHAEGCPCRTHFYATCSCPASPDGRGGGVKRKPGCTCMGMCRPDCGGNRNDPGHLLSCAIHAHGNCDCGATP